MSENASTVRSLWNRLLGKSHNGRRDRYEVFGWKHTLRTEDFVSMYHRNGIASRIVRAFPKATWGDTPNVYDETKDGDEKPDSLTGAWQRLNKELSVVHYMERADRLSSLGQFGLLYMGFADALPVSEPVVGAAQLVYLSAYSEQNVSVQRWDMDEKSPRFGLPVIYTLMTSSMGQSGKNSQTKSMTVHHSRVIHLSEFLDDDEVYGVPRLLPSYNYLEDLEKVTGASSETFWLTANRGILWTADSDAEFDEDDRVKMKEQAEEYEHQLRRNITGTGIKAQVLGSETPDPNGNTKNLLSLIAGTHGMPQRILVGAEAGELASSQDSSNWIGQIDDRRATWAGPRVLMPFIVKMVETGNLPRPVGSITAGWDPSAGLTDKEKAEIAKAKTTALAAYVATDGADLVVPIREFRAEILGLPEVSIYEEEPEEEEDEEDEDVQDAFQGNASV